MTSLKFAAMTRVWELALDRSGLAITLIGAWVPAPLPIVFEALTALAFLVCAALLFLRVRRPGVVCRGTLLLFGLFALCCGLAYLVETLAVRYENFPLAGALKALRAVASWAALLGLLSLLPRMLNLVCSRELEREIAVRRQAEAILQDQSRQQAVVVELCLWALEDVGIEELMTAATTLVCQGLRVDFAGLEEVLPDGAQLLLRAGTGWNEGTVGQAREPMGPDFLSGQVLTSKEPILVEDLRTEQRFRPSPLLTDHHAVSVLAVLVPGRERPFGVLLAGTRSPRSFTRHDGSVLLAVAHVLGMAIEWSHAAEVRAQHTRELARSNAELAQFAYVASHDLQEPLRAVGGCVQVLQRRYQGHLDDRADELIRHTVDGVARMQNLIHGLLAYGRVGTHGQPFNRVAVDSALDNALTNLRAAVESSGAAVTHDTLPQVMGDATQLTQLLQNLIGNAVKFCPKQMPKIHVSAQRCPGAWKLAVHDNGIGIEPEYFDRIFGLFQRLHTRTEYPGTGIGLAICKKIVERHGGRIWVDSAVGRGTTFYFTIPEPEEEAA